MGNPFYVHLSSDHILCCLNCGVHVANYSDVGLVSHNYYIIHDCVNVKQTHQHIIECISCSMVLGQFDMFYSNLLIWDLTDV
jgi:hypothetical protein